MVAAAQRLFATGLLRGRSIAVAGCSPAPVAETLVALGARVCRVDQSVIHDDGQLAERVRAAAPLHALVGGEEEVSLAATWAAVSTVAAEAFIPRGEGRIILLAAGPAADVVAAGLENLARTLSVEWARFGITAVAIATGAATTDEQLAQVVAFLCSEAGAYYSGCRFDLGVSL